MTEKERKIKVKCLKRILTLISERNGDVTCVECLVGS